MIVYRVVCKDGLTRHAGSFSSRDEARDWATTRHGCSTLTSRIEHHIVEVHWTPTVTDL